jgi:hypothetical protein
LLFEMSSEMRELPYTLAFDQIMSQCLRNMSSPLPVKKLDVVGAISSSIGVKYSLQVAVMQCLFYGRTLTDAKLSTFFQGYWVGSGWYL